MSERYFDRIHKTIKTTKEFETNHGHYKQVCGVRVGVGVRVV